VKTPHFSKKQIPNLETPSERVESSPRPAHPRAMPQSLAKILVHTVFSTKVSFQDEFRQLLRRYEIEFDERYVWH
jgi:hypothetical protein